MTSHAVVQVGVVPGRPAAEQLQAVGERAAAEGRAAAARLEVLVAAAVQLLVGGHAEAHHQVHLEAGQHRHPEQVERGIEHHPRDPAVAGDPGERLGGRGALVAQVARAAPQHPAAHEDEAAQEADEVAVVVGADAVADPGTVVVELGDAAVAHGAVLGPQRAPHQARRAEPRRLEPAARRLRQLDDRLLRAPMSPHEHVHKAVMQCDMYAALDAINYDLVNSQRK